MSRYKTVRVIPFSGKKAEYSSWREKWKLIAIASTSRFLIAKLVSHQGKQEIPFQEGYLVLSSDRAMTMGGG